MYTTQTQLLINKCFIEIARNLANYIRPVLKCNFIFFIMLVRELLSNSDFDCCMNKLFKYNFPFLARQVSAFYKLGWRRFLYLKMLYSNLPQDYKKTFSRYIYLFKFIGIQFFDEPGGVLTKANLKLSVFIITFLPFVIGQFSLISKIRTDNFLESVRVVPVDIMFFLGKLKLRFPVLKSSINILNFWLIFWRIR